MRLLIIAGIPQRPIFKFLKSEILILCLCIFTLTSSFSQISQERFRHITNENGLSNTTINCIYQGYRGFMYFGTRDGLNRYDGVNVRVFKNNPKDPNSISDNYIRCIYENKKNHEFWIGTSYGHNLYDRINSRFKSYKHNKNHKNSISSNIITGIAPASDDKHLWVATLDAGLNYFDIQKAISKHFRHKANEKNSISSDSISCLFKDRQNRIWIGTQNGVDIIDLENFKITPNVLKNNRPVTAITQDLKGNMWFGVEDIGLVSYDTAKRLTKIIQQAKSEISDTTILTLLTDHKGNIWIGKVNDGLSQVNTKTQKTYNYYPIFGISSGPSNSAIPAIFEDRQGNMWFGTHRGGVNLYSAGADKFKLYRKGPNPNSLSYNDVKAFFEDSDKSIWVGTDSGLNKMNHENGDFTVYKNEERNPESLSSNAVQTIAADAQNNLLVGTWGSGLNLFDRRTKTFRIPKRSI